MKHKAIAGRGGKVRIFVVDDHPFLRQGLVYSISREPDMVVCGEAESAEEGLTGIGLTKPDVLLTDIVLPGKSGLELVKDVTATYPEVAVVVLSMHSEPHYAERALQAGARGYLMKLDGASVLVTAIRRVLGGQIYVSESIASRLLEGFSPRRKPVTTSSPVEKLSDRELEIFELIGSACSSRQIADQLHISIKTVEAHRANIKQKLSLKGAPELIRYAVQWLDTRDSSKPA